VTEKQVYDIHLFILITALNTFLCTHPKRKCISCSLRVRVSTNKIYSTRIRKELQRILPIYYHVTYPRFHVNTNNLNISTNQWRSQGGARGGSAPSTNLWAPSSRFLKNIVFQWNIKLNTFCFFYLLTDLMSWGKNHHKKQLTLYWIQGSRSGGSGGV
jgi:hypothetical protein